MKVLRLWNYWTPPFEDFGDRILHNTNSPNPRHHQNMPRNGCARLMGGFVSSQSYAKATFTFHFPGDSAVVHFKGTVLVQVWLVQAGAVFVRRCVSCSLCSRNQRGNTESICLWRKGTAVVHRQEIRSLKAVPPPPSPPLLFLPLLCLPTAQKAREGCTRRNGSCAKKKKKNALFSLQLHSTSGAPWLMRFAFFPRRGFPQLL